MREQTFDEKQTHSLVKREGDNRNYRYNLSERRFQISAFQISGLLFFSVKYEGSRKRVGGDTFKER